MKRIDLLVIFLLSLCFLCDCGTKDQDAPAVEILSPEDGAILCNVQNISITAIDNKQVASIELFLDGSSVTTVEDSVLNYQWNTRFLPDNSEHQIYACAVDMENNIGYSDTISVKVFNNLDNTEIFIWFYDRMDKFFDPTINDSIDCAYYIEQILSASGYDYDLLEFLPPDLTPYKVGFILLGWERC